MRQESFFTFLILTKVDRFLWETYFVLIFAYLCISLDCRLKKYPNWLHLKKTHSLVICVRQLGGRSNAENSLICSASAERAAPLNDVCNKFNKSICLIHFSNQLIISFPFHSSGSRWNASWLPSPFICFTVCGLKTSLTINLLLVSRSVGCKRGFLSVAHVFYTKSCVCFEWVLLLKQFNPVAH